MKCQLHPKTDKYYCVPCKGTGICTHGKRKSLCNQPGCGGQGLCKKHPEFKKDRCTPCGCIRVDKKCPHEKRIGRCHECNEGKVLSEKCKNHPTTDSRLCIPCGGSAVCLEHNQLKSRCKCNTGSEICPHEKMKYFCIPCHGAGICVHKRIKSQCGEEDCRGSRRCKPHNKLLSQCRECGGSIFCRHDKQKYQCRDIECNKGSLAMCAHGQRASCKKCDGTQICEHKKRISMCVSCGGSELCEHGHHGYYCKPCAGKGICRHEKQRSNCHVCRPNNKYICHGCHLYRVGKKTDFLCWYCNPNRSKKQKTKEIRVKDLLEDEKLEFTYDKEFKNDCCLKYRPDFVFDCKTYYVILECDEDAHDQYERDCEMIRMNLIMESIGKPVLFIRFNPDHKGYTQEEKESVLMDTLIDNMNREVLEDIEPIYLFYP